MSGLDSNWTADWFGSRSDPKGSKHEHCPDMFVWVIYSDVNHTERQIRSTLNFWFYVILGEQYTET